MTQTAPELRKAQRVAIAQRLRAVRKRRQLTGKDLAAALGIRNDSLSKMELGQQVIPAELLVDWCGHLQISIRSIAVGNGAKDVLQELPPRYAALFSGLSPAHRRLVLEHMEMVARLEMEEERGEDEKE